MAQVVEERGTLFAVAVKEHKVVFGPGDACVEVLQLLTPLHIRLSLSGQAQGAPVLCVHLNLHAF